MQLWVHGTVYSCIINDCTIFHMNNCNPVSHPVYLSEGEQLHVDEGRGGSLVSASRQRQALHTAARSCAGTRKNRHFHLQTRKRAQRFLTKHRVAARGQGPGRTAEGPALPPSPRWVHRGTRGLAHTPAVPTWASGCWSTFQVRCEGPMDQWVSPHRDRDT